MARYTMTQAELNHAAKMNQVLPISGIVTFQLKNGGLVEGIVRKIDFGNNGGDGGVWRYYGEYQIETITKQRLTIDVLDIDRGAPAPESRYADYEKAGLISIIR